MIRESAPNRLPRPWRVAVALASAPPATLAVFFLGLGVNGVDTEYAPYRFLLVVLLCGPAAPAIGMAVAVTVAFPQPADSWRERAAAVAVALAALAVAGYTWSQVYFSYFPRPWGG